MEEFEKNAKMSRINRKITKTVANAVPTPYTYRARKDETIPSPNVTLLFVVGGSNNDSIKQNENCISSQTHIYTHKKPLPTKLYIKRFKNSKLPIIHCYSE